jgi:stage V sporulation protein G
MEITEIRIYPKEGIDKKLKAFATITFDGAFVIRDVKVIEGGSGLFVAMPSRKLREPCAKCGCLNAVRSRYCSQCGGSLSGPSTHKGHEEKGRLSEHRDVAHPITTECRERIQGAVLQAYETEMTMTKGPGN